MDVGEKLEQLKNLCLADTALKQRLLDTKQSSTPLSDFCILAREAGVELYEMDVVAFGEDSYAAMRRSTNEGKMHRFLNGKMMRMNCLWQSWR